MAQRYKGAKGYLGKGSLDQSIIGLILGPMMYVCKAKENKCKGILGNWVQRSKGPLGTKVQRFKGSLEQRCNGVLERTLSQ